jgi:hypothetical protein
VAWNNGVPITTATSPSKSTHFDASGSEIGTCPVPIEPAPFTKSTGCSGGVRPVATIFER